MKKQLIEGVKWNEDSKTFDFNWKHDEKSDVLGLSLNYKPKALSFGSDENIGVKVYFPYKVNKDVESTVKNSFLKHLKNLDFESNDFKTLISKGVLGLNKIFTISSFDVIVTPESSSKLNFYYANSISKKNGTGLFLSNALVKNVIDNITIDSKNYINGAKDEAGRKKRIANIKYDMKKINERGYFKISDIHSSRRSLYTNYIVFKDEVSRKVFNAINGGSVLLVDDIYTSGATIKESIREIMKYAPNRIIVTTLIKN